jgi:hypothetical protein
MPRARGNEIEKVTEAQFKKHLKETYANPEAAGKFYAKLIETRRRSIDAFAKEVSGKEELADRFARDPIGLLHERKLLGPLDQISIEGLRYPFVDWPWPWPICRVVCSVQVEVVWSASASGRSGSAGRPCTSVGAGSAASSAPELWSEEGAVAGPLLLLVAAPRPGRIRLPPCC